MKLQNETMIVLSMLLGALERLMSLNAAAISYLNFPVLNYYAATTKIFMLAENHL